MKIQTALSMKDFIAVPSQGIAVLLSEGFTAQDYAAVSNMVTTDVSAYLEFKKFKGTAESNLVLPVIHDGKMIKFFFVGLGKKDSSGVLNIESYRRALGTLITTAQAKKLESLVFAIPQASDYGVAADFFTQQTASIVEIAGYKFDEFITAGEKAKDMMVTICCGTNDENLVQAGFAAGQVIAQAVNRDRDWVNTPPSRMTPTHIADKAQALAEGQGLKCTIFDGKKIEELGMEGLHGVARGSIQDPRFVIIEYKSKNPNAQTIGFVGKGITFDSGGLSIKPADSMEEMKSDMAGAASVINSIVALAQLQPDVNIIAAAAITENLPGHNALKPGDILKFYNGKTAEVRNTDAEGRLVLADALSYITKNYELDAVIDLATLTGACIYAVGPFFSALLSDNQGFADKVKAAGTRSGDQVWALPFTTDFKAAIKSDIADMQNVGNRSIAAGTITAAWFLREFVENETPWVHLDIASTSFNVPNTSYYRSGATGSSVRLLIDLAMNWKA
ncbi:leucyl aminopeptidase [Candidatus Babeliales bacterium]|nr:leucyl aminopeptidase [Candidatus Babeliales bacterium]MBP9844021.1 leucyl aminopeptidase [Candidatus Babeliales bacterium]